MGENLDNLPLLESWFSQGSGLCLDPNSPFCRLCGAVDDFDAASKKLRVLEYIDGEWIEISSSSSQADPRSWWSRIGFWKS